MKQILLFHNLTIDHSYKILCKNLIIKIKIINAK